MNSRQLYELAIIVKTSVEPLSPSMPAFRYQEIVGIHALADGLRTLAKMEAQREQA